MTSQNPPCPVEAPEFIQDPVIVCAAMRNAEGEIICGPRHYDKIMNQQLRRLARNDWRASITQGFVDQYGNFLTREEAWEIAIRKGQIVRRVGGDEGKLFSENLY